MHQNDQIQTDRSSITETTATDVATSAVECADISEAASTTDAEVELDTASSASSLIDADRADRLADAEESLEESAGDQMHVLHETLKGLEGADWLGCDAVCDAGTDLRTALDELDSAYMTIVDAAEFEGVDLTPEDKAAQELVAAELAAVNRRLIMLIALANVRDAARRLGRIACRPETLLEH